MSPHKFTLDSAVEAARTEDRSVRAPVEATMRSLKRGRRGDKLTDPRACSRVNGALTCEDEKEYRRGVEGADE